MKTSAVSKCLLCASFSVALSLHVQAVGLPSVGSANHAPGWSGGGGSFTPAFSGNGRFIVFVSHANNLVSNDDHGLTLDVFVRDRLSHTTQLVSVNTNGLGGGNDNAIHPSISSNGQFIAFASSASNLVLGDTNNASDVFVRDLLAGTSTLVSVNLAGTAPVDIVPAPVIPLSGDPLISGDGRWVAFESRAAGLVTNFTSGVVDIFVRDLQSQQTMIITVSADGMTGGSASSDLAGLSPDGHFVLFSSLATNLVTHPVSPGGEVYVRDLQAGVTRCLSTNAASYFDPTAGFPGSSAPVLSASGGFAVFRSSATNAAAALVFHYDLQNAVTTLITSNAPVDSEPALSADGQTVAYANGPNLYVWQRATGSNELVNVNLDNTGPGNAPADTPVLSLDGTRVLFLSAATDLETHANNGVAQLFVRDLMAKTTRLVSANTNGEASRESVAFTLPAFSADSRLVAFESTAADLVPDDLNQFSDVFVRDLDLAQTTLISRRLDSLPAATPRLISRAEAKSISADGRYLAFTSLDGSFVAGDTNRQRDAFVRDLVTGAITPLSVDSNGVFASNLTALQPVLSSNGQFAAFVWQQSLSLTSTANAVFWRDLRSNIVAQVNVRTNGEPGSAADLLAISPDGRLVLFQSSAPASEFIAGITDTNGGNDLFIRDMIAGTNQLVSINNLGTGAGNASSTNATLSPDGHWVTFVSSSTNLTTNKISGPSLFARDLTTQRTRLAATLGLSGLSGPANFSGNSRFVAYITDDFKGRFIAVFDLLNWSSNFVCYQGNSPSLSSDGHFIAYAMLNWAGRTTNVLRQDLYSGSTRLAGKKLDNTPAGPHQFRSPVISGDGRFVVSASILEDLVPNDRNQVNDIFVYDLLLDIPVLVSSNAQGGSGNGLSSQPMLAANGRTVVFQSFASDLVPGDYNDTRDVFVVDLGGVDSNYNGIDDDWELAYFGTLSRNGTGDFDDDGLSDLQEFFAGTNPTNRTDVLRVITVSSPGSAATTVLWVAVPGHSYRVQYQSSVDGSGWIDLPGLVTPMTSTGRIVDPAAGVEARRFYRVLLAR